MLYYSDMETNVVQGAFKPRRFWKTWQFAVGVIIVVLAIAGAVVYARIQHDRNVKRANQAEEKSLFTQLQQSGFLQNGDNSTIQLANELLAGVQSKKYTMNSTDLGQVYLSRATAYTNQGKLQLALSDYQQAATTDASLKIGALQGELTIQSRLGNKSALVPILQQLVPLLQHSEMPLSNQQAAQYQDDITAIQSGQEVSF
jgi:hypothetical protein